MKATLIIPCYNEEHRFPGETFVSFAREHPELTFLFVDDGSTDRTRACIEAVEGVVPGQIGSLLLETNQGKAEAVRRGILEALEGEPDLVGYWDCDLATPLDAIPEFLEVFAQRPEVEIVVGARVQLLGRRIVRDPLRHYLGRCFATVASLLLGLRIYDTQCGAKMFRRTGGTRELFERPFLSRWIFDVELLARYLARVDRVAARRAEDALYEVALKSWEDVRGSKVRPADFPRAFLDLIRIYRAYPRRRAPGA